MLISFDVYSWLVTYTPNVEENNLGISERIIMHDIQLRNTRTGLRKALLFLVLLFTSVPSRWRGVQY